MKVSKTPSGNYDTEELEYCCPDLKSLVVTDGGAIKLNEKGLVLRANPEKQPRRLKYCPMCSTEIIHEDTTVEEPPLEQPKPLQRDTNKAAANQTSDFKAIGK